jgi:hypothetical protein
MQICKIAPGESFGEEAFLCYVPYCHEQQGTTPIHSRCH